MSVCDDQNTFNQAFHDAVKYELKKEKPNKTAQIVGSIIYIALLFWAVSLAMKIQPKSESVEHILLAVLFPPVYIMAYYIGNQ
jgi:hypothetical protein